jgi:hypothetical protein
MLDLSTSSLSVLWCHGPLGRVLIHYDWVILEHMGITFAGVTKTNSNP